MKDGDEKYKRGELTADMAAVKRDITDIKVGQKEILKRIDNLQVVTVERWEKRNAYVDTKFGEHSAAIEALQEYNRLERNSMFYKIRQFIGNTAIKVIGASLFGLMVVAALYYLQRTSEYAEMMKDYQAKVKQ